VVEHRQRQRLEQHRLPEGALDGQDRRAREVELALRVAGHVPGELVVPQPAGGVLVDRSGREQGAQLVVVEAELGQRVEQPAGPGDHPVAAPVGQPPGEHLEHAAAVRGPVTQRGPQHRQLVAVGEEPGVPRHPPSLGAVQRVSGGVPPGRGATRLGDMSVAPVETVRPDEDVETGSVVVPDKPWVTIVWNDPVNLMSYVAYVFQKHFGYKKEKAAKLMLDVHEKGKAVVSNGTREEMERDVEAMHGYGLWATMQHDE
jgi:ATP-dependent Clp protease adaptor protein ClpS